MNRIERGNKPRPVVWFLIVFGLSALVGIWNAEDPTQENRRSETSTGTSFTQQTDQESRETKRLEQMEATLAQAGCPGWMVLASEGEAALQPPASLVPGDVQQTALRVPEANVSPANYSTSSTSTPVRVASQIGRPQLTRGAIDDPDDLLDGVPDLLAVPAERPQATKQQQKVQQKPGPKSEPKPEFKPVPKSEPKQKPIKRPEPEQVQPGPVTAPSVPEQTTVKKPAVGQTPIPEPVFSAPPPPIVPQQEQTPQPQLPLPTEPAAEPEVIEPKVVAPKVVEPEVEEPEVERPGVAEPRVVEPKNPVEPPVVEPVAPETGPAFTPPAASQAKESKESAEPNSVEPTLPAPERKPVRQPEPVEVPRQEGTDTPEDSADDLLAEEEDLLNGDEDLLTDKDDLLSGEDDDLLSSPEKPKQSPFLPPPAPKQPVPHSVPAGSSSSPPKQSQSKTYCEFVAETNFPSAHVCAKCHEKIFDEWSVSSHAYAAISPMFHKFEQKINDLSQGTVGYFCYRCHSPVGTTLGVSRAAPLWDLPQVAREGVTCVACHRVNQRYGRANGERRIEPGDIHAPVYGSIGGGGIAEVIAKKDYYKVKTSPHEQGPGQAIHVAGARFDQLGKSEFCTSCHQVAVHPGIKLEVVWEQYRASPACKKGVSCQDCHMGRQPGVPSGYAIGAAAKVGDKVVNTRRKHANHIFYGPGYSIAHPGVFPHNSDAHRWSMKDWLLFDWRAGWGTEEFEQRLEAGQIFVQFPPVWAEVDDRFDARDIIEDNLKKLEVKKLSRQQTMENGSHVDGPFFDTPLVRGRDFKFHYVMTNTNEGHNLPSGSLGAQPQLWANVVLIGPRGQRLWESGYTDRWGDVADIHSVDVRNKRIPYDWQLFNLQTMFLITGAKGTDREFFLPVNVDFDQLPFLRPGAQPISTINHPPFIRMEGRSLAPLGSRKIPYKVPAHLMLEPGAYRLSFRLRSRAEPIYFMRFCDSTEEMNRAMNEGMIDFHQTSVEFFVQ